MTPFDVHLCFSSPLTLHVPEHISNKQAVCKQTRRLLGFLQAWQVLLCTIQRWEALTNHSPWDGFGFPPPWWKPPPGHGFGWPGSMLAGDSPWTWVQTRPEMRQDGQLDSPRVIWRGLLHRVHLPVNSKRSEVPPLPLYPLAFAGGRFLGEWQVERSQCIPVFLAARRPKASLFLPIRLGVAHSASR